MLRSHTKLPEWLRIVAVEDAGQADKYLQLVDVGEAEAIELARELHADRLLIDERKGRKLATKEGVPIIGLLGVVLLAKRKNLISFAQSFNVVARVSMDSSPKSNNSSTSWKYFLECSRLIHPARHLRMKRNGPIEKGGGHIFE